MEAGFMKEVFIN